jgi:membrane-bound metal-dependent hydrolase YbcI (DUF457 family)
LHEWFRGHTWAILNKEEIARMFVGHYAAALVLRPLKKSPSLPVLFVAVQLMDILFFSLMLAGTESLRIVPGITAMNPLDLHDMPFSHGLVGVLVQSALFGLLIAALMGDGQRIAGGLIAAAAVFSHWVLDVVTHRPDMMLFADTDKIGAALWNHPQAAMVVEGLIVAVAFALYVSATRAREGAGRWSLIVLAVAMIGLQCVNWFGPQPDPAVSLAFVAAQGLAAYGIFAGLAWWVEAAREV